VPALRRYAKVPGAAFGIGARTMKIAALALLVLCTLAVNAAGLYKWVDKDGRVQYTDTPPPTGTKNVEQRKATGNVIQSNEPSFALQQAMKNFPVTLWVNACGELCDQARELLAKRGVPFTEKNPQTPESVEEFKKAAGNELQVPLVQIGALKTIKGFEPGEWNGALDAAGYPSSGPAIKPAAKPPAPKPAAAGAPAGK
jgi:hypothetical protein